MHGPLLGPNSGEAISLTSITRPSAGLKTAPSGATAERSGSRLKNARLPRRTTARIQTGSHDASQPAAATAIRVAAGSFAEGSSGNRNREFLAADDWRAVSSRFGFMCAILSRCKTHLS